MTSDDAVQLAQQVELVLHSRVLDRSPQLPSLLQHLAQYAATGRPLSEGEIARDVFGRADPGSPDAAVRAYVHRLRRKLDAYYAGPGRLEPLRLAIPADEYRLSVVPQAFASSKAPRRFIAWIALAIGAVVAALLVVAGQD